MLLRLHAMAPLIRELAAFGILPHDAMHEGPCRAGGMAARGGLHGRSGQEVGAAHRGSRRACTHSHTM